MLTSSVWKRVGGFAAILMLAFVTLSETSVIANQTGNPSGMTLTGSALKSFCKREILKKPAYAGGFMIHPGKENQTTGAYNTYDRVDPACDSRYVRMAFGRVELQDYKNRKKWWRLGDRGYKPNLGWSLITNFNRAGEFGTYSMNSYHKKVLYYKPGSGTKVRFKLRIEAKVRKSGASLGQKRWVFPVKVCWKRPSRSCSI